MKKKEYPLEKDEYKSSRSAYAEFSAAKLNCLAGVLSIYSVKEASLVPILPLSPTSS